MLKHLIDFNILHNNRNQVCTVIEIINVGSSDFDFNSKLDLFYKNIPTEFVEAFKYAFNDLDEACIDSFLNFFEIKIDDRVGSGFMHVSSPVIIMHTEVDNSITMRYDAYGIVCNRVSLTYRVGEVDRFIVSSVIRTIRNPMFISHYTDERIVLALQLFFKYRCKFPFTDDVHMFINGNLAFYLSIMDDDLRKRHDISILVPFVRVNMDKIGDIIDICHKYNMMELLMNIMNITNDISKSEFNLRL